MRSFIRDVWSRPEIRQSLFTILGAVGLYFILPDSMSEAAKRVACIFMIAAVFWAFEVIPLYATSLVVVLLETFLLCRPGGVLNMTDSGYQMFLVPFGSPIIMLFFGGFVLAAALSKYQIDQLIARRMLKLFGTKPFHIMLGFMACTAFLSMWMSNTATTAMMIAMVLPLLKQIDEDSPFRTALILSIPFAANIGGIGTPVGTPPNAIAIGILADKGIHVGFLSWMKMAVPLAVGLIIVTAVILYTMYPSRKKEIALDLSSPIVIGRKALLTMVIAGLTILLWLTSELHKIPSAVIALLAAGLLASSGLLARDDFKKIDWDVLVLMWGGLALGKGMDVSGLTKWLVSMPVFEQTGLLLVVIFAVMAVLFSTFMSNTATANLLVPVVVMIPGESPVLLAAVIALSCSFAMALPVSTPPNAIAFATNMLKSRDMLKAGAIISLIATGLVILGFKFVITQALGV